VRVVIALLLKETIPFFEVVGREEIFDPGLLEEGLLVFFFPPVRVPFLRVEHPLESLFILHP
jgi:hypothetical protein